MQAASADKQVANASAPTTFGSIQEENAAHVATEKDTTSAPSASAAMFDKPAAVQQEVSTPILKAEISAPKDETKFTRPDGSVVALVVRKNSETGHAGLYINQKEVVRFRATIEGKTPYQRAQRMAESLSGFLKEGGKPEEIRPMVENGQTVLKARDVTLAVVGAVAAESLQSTPEALAAVWATQIRQALGGSPYLALSKAPAKPAVPAWKQAKGRDDWSKYIGSAWSGMASWYGGAFHGRRSADGTRFNQYSLTAAHRFLPFGTPVKVTNHRTGKSCVVRISDRGPYSHGRIIDVSRGAAAALGMISSGVAKVSVQVLPQPNKP
jgi:hypothetical protein